jgi:hypothetical protein
MNMTTFSPLGIGKGEYRRKRGGGDKLRAREVGQK